MNKQQFIASATTIHPSLVRNVIAKFGGWATFLNVAPDVVRHGMDGGFDGFIYMHETVAFYKANRLAILKLARLHASECDYDTAAQFVSSFGALKLDAFPVTDIDECLLFDVDSHDGYDTVANVMTWYAAEAVCQAYVDAVNE